MTAALGLAVPAVPAVPQPYQTLTAPVGHASALPERPVRETAALPALRRQVAGVYDDFGRAPLPLAPRVITSGKRWGPLFIVHGEEALTRRTWAAANNVEIAYTPTNSSWLNHIEAQFTALRYVTLDGTDHAGHREQGSMIRRYIIWRNRHADDQRLRAVIDRANAA